MIYLTHKKLFHKGNIYFLYDQIQERKFNFFSTNPHPKKVKEKLVNLFPLKFCSHQKEIRKLER